MKTSPEWITRFESIIKIERIDWQLRFSLKIIARKYFGIIKSLAVSPDN